MTALPNRGIFLAATIVLAMCLPACKGCNCPIDGTGLACEDQASNGTPCSLVACADQLSLVARRVVIRHIDLLDTVKWIVDEVNHRGSPVDADILASLDTMTLTRPWADHVQQDMSPAERQACYGTWLGHDSGTGTLPGFVGASSLDAHTILACPAVRHSPHSVNASRQGDVVVTCGLRLGSLANATSTAQDDIVRVLTSLVSTLASDLSTGDLHSTPPIQIDEPGDEAGSCSPTGQVDDTKVAPLITTDPSTGALLVDGTLHVPCASLTWNGVDVGDLLGRLEEAVALSQTTTTTTRRGITTRATTTTTITTTTTTSGTRTLSCDSSARCNGQTYSVAGGEELTVSCSGQASCVSTFEVNNGGHLIMDCTGINSCSNLVVTSSGGKVTLRCTSQQSCNNARVSGFGFTLGMTCSNTGACSSMQLGGIDIEADIRCSWSTACGQVRFTSCPGCAVNLSCGDIRACESISFVPSSSQAGLALRVPSKGGFTGPTCSGSQYRCPNGDCQGISSQCFSIIP